MAGYKLEIDLCGFEIDVRLKYNVNGVAHECVSNLQKVEIPVTSKDPSRVMQLIADSLRKLAEDA